MHGAGVYMVFVSDSEKTLRRIRSADNRFPYGDSEWISWFVDQECYDE
jgi:hypothetical protein